MMEDIEIVTDNRLNEAVAATNRATLRGAMTFTALVAYCDEYELVWAATWSGELQHILTRHQPLLRATFGVSLCGLRYTWVPSPTKEREERSPCIKCMQILMEKEESPS